MSEFAGFPGFTAPQCTQVPDLIFDRFLPELTGAELKALLYIVRRTYGFHKLTDNISLAQLQHGITKRDGTQLDHGTGLSKNALLGALRSLEEKTLIIREARESEERGHEPSNYRLRMVPGAENEPPLAPKANKGGAITEPSPSTRNRAIQDPALQETDHKKPRGAPNVAPSRARPTKDVNRMSPEEEREYRLRGPYGHLVQH